MGKLREEKFAPKNHIHSRVSYLYQAANFLHNQSTNIPRTLPTESNKTKDQTSSHGDVRPQYIVPKSRGLQHHLITQLRSVSLKGQVRLSSDIKRAVCKKCGALLVPGTTCNVRLENKSRNGRKAWADVHIISCNSCGMKKRFPVGAARPKRKSLRELPSMEVIEPTTKMVGHEATENVSLS